VFLAFTQFVFFPAACCRWWLIHIPHFLSFGKTG
jgi:hypothetical protein